MSSLNSSLTVLLSLGVRVPPLFRSAEFARQAADHSVDDKTVAAYIHVVERCIQAEEAIWASVHPR